MFIFLPLFSFIVFIGAETYVCQTQAGDYAACSQKVLSNTKPLKSNKTGNYGND